ncbi:MAG: hypothetical protein Q4B86_05375, partial [Eubacteriales bacterium]|nr:hypothetical protein [Eubacteriales bacterium]
EDDIGGEYFDEEYPEDEDTDELDKILNKNGSKIDYIKFLQEKEDIVDDSNNKKKSVHESCEEIDRLVDYLDSNKEKK